MRPGVYAADTLSQNDETLRWPTNLDRAGIEKRLEQARAEAEKAGLADVAALLTGVAAMSGAQLGGAVVAALNILQDRSEHRPVTMTLEMVAMNLKNLKK